MVRRAIPSDSGFFLADAIVGVHRTGRTVHVCLITGKNAWFRYDDEAGAELTVIGVKALLDSDKSVRTISLPIQTDSA